MPAGSDAVVMLRGRTILIERLTVIERCVGLVESVTVIAAVVVPAAAGIPVIWPVDTLMPRPDGSPLADQVYGPVPPPAVTVVAYA
jgi:hypothetical protein